MVSPNIIIIAGLSGVFLGMGLLYLSVRFVSMITGWMGKKGYIND